MEEDRKENFVSETNIRGIEKKSMNGEEKKKRDSFVYRSFSKKGIRTVRTFRSIILSWAAHAGTNYLNNKYWPISVTKLSIRGAND